MSYTLVIVIALFVLGDQILSGKGKLQRTSAGETSKIDLKMSLDPKGPFRLFMV